MSNMKLFEEKRNVSNKELPFREAIKYRKRLINFNLEFLNNIPREFIPRGGFNKVGDIYIADSSGDLYIQGSTMKMYQKRLVKDSIGTSDIILPNKSVKGDGSERFIRVIDLKEMDIVYLGVWSIVVSEHEISPKHLGDFFIDRLGNIYIQLPDGSVQMDYEYFKKVFFSKDGIREIKFAAGDTGINEFDPDDFSILGRETNMFDELVKINVYDRYDWRNMSVIQHLFQAILKDNEVWEKHASNLKYKGYLETDFSKFANPILTEDGHTEVSIIKGKFSKKGYIVVRFFDANRYNIKGEIRDNIPSANLKHREVLRLFANKSGWMMFQNYGINNWSKVDDDDYYNDWVNEFASYVNPSAFKGTVLEDVYIRALEMSNFYRYSGTDSYASIVDCFYAYLKHPYIRMLEEDEGIKELSASVISSPKIKDYDPLVGVMDIESDTIEGMLGVTEDQLKRIKDAVLFSHGGVYKFKAFFSDEIDTKFVDVSEISDGEHNKLIDLLSEFHFTFGSDKLDEYANMLRKAHSKFGIGTVNSLGNILSKFISRNPEIVKFNKTDVADRYINYADRVLDLVPLYERKHFNFRSVEDLNKAYERVVLNEDYSSLK